MTASLPYISPTTPGTVITEDEAMAARKRTTVARDAAKRATAKHAAASANAAYWERECLRAFHAHYHALEDGRWLDAVSNIVTAQTLEDVGYGGTLPRGALTAMSEALDRLTADGTQVTPLEGER